MTFQKRCREAARKFLQTVVVIDDRLWDGHSKDRPTAGLKGPGVSDSNEGQSPDSSAVTTSHARRTSASSDKNPPIDTSCLAEAFASQELICGMIQPNSEYPIAESTIRAVSRADVVVLDWDLDESHERVGDMASQLLADVFKNDTKGGVNRRRLFILYTGHASEIDAIRKKISSKADDLQWNDGPSYETATGLHIVLWAKDGLGAPDDVPKVDEANLPSKVIDEFATINEGLLSNVVLSGLAAVRDNSHALLARVPAQIDPAFIAHRLYLPSPADSEEHVVALLADEVHTVLEESHTGEMVSLDACCEFVTAKTPTLDLASRGSNYNDDEWREILESGLGNEESNVNRKFLNASSKTKRRKVHQCFTSVSESFNLPADGCDEQFAALTSLCQPYGVKAKLLTLGTIVRSSDTKSDDEGCFLLCIQPPCDCVRLTATRPFPFLPLDRAEKDKPFHLALPFEDSFIRLRIDTHAYNCRMIPFAPNPDRVRSVEGVFSANDKEETEFEWIAQLKWGYAQKVITEFASQTCRVGIDQSEWLRRSNPVSH